IGPQMARAMFAAQPELNHTVVAHTDTTSMLLYNLGDYVRPALFGDGAGAVVVSREFSKDKEGLISVVALQDQSFLGHIEIDMNNELYHAPNEIKKVAVQSMVDCAQKVLDTAGLTSDQVTWFVPHQTGNGIIHKTARMLSIP